MPPSLSELKVCDLTDFDNMRWKEAMIQELFVPCDAEVILGIPLCASWPNDKLVWHYSADGAFSVRSAYCMIVHFAHQSVGIFREPFRPLTSHPCIKMFCWRVSRGILSSNGNLAKRVSSFNMACAMCGHPKESDTHAVLECPLAISIWEGSDFEPTFWAKRFRSLRDCLGSTCT
ncbi:hypothetical protein Cgig2_001492 [Carnegiea gigantea]|uniref:Reverse transcriptase zinc-binding domain-containing protein n=1 Tax=Carnegiea gigantea TaxID=171969 RepID=A0A9Q1QQC6_9CARY|nr:hypothetical protein Cgig2_001492 [Carnegiea gigantea]